MREQQVFLVQILVVLTETVATANTDVSNRRSGDSKTAIERRR